MAGKLQKCYTALDIPLWKIVAIVLYFPFYFGIFGLSASLGLIGDFSEIGFRGLFGVALLLFPSFGWVAVWTIVFDKGASK